LANPYEEFGVERANGNAQADGSVREGFGVRGGKAPYADPEGGANIPYIGHLLSVASLVVESGGNEMGGMVFPERGNSHLDCTVWPTPGAGGGIQTLK